MYKVRSDWLQKHAKKYPQWGPVVEKLIENNCFIVVPADREQKMGRANLGNLLVLEPEIKGRPAEYRIQDGMVICVNYPGSHRPVSVDDWIVYVTNLAASIEEGNAWIEEILSR
jgi:hypothetical protein